MSANTQPISIIIATYNAAGTFVKCMDCIRNQSFKDFELIVIDGGSTDATLAIAKENSDLIDYFVSEPDAGIYDAWNKGLAQARGEWIMFVGSDDYLLPDALETYQSFMNNNALNDVYYISSKVEIISDRGERRRVFGWPWVWHIFKKKHIVAHPGSLHHKNLFKNFGAYDTQFKIVGDYEILLRAKEKLNARFINQITLQMTEGGVSTSLKVCAETRRAQLVNRVNAPFFINCEFAIQVGKLVGKRLFQYFGVNVFLRKEFTR